MLHDNVLTDMRKQVGVVPKLNLAVMCDFQKCGILTSVDSDKPAQSLFKLRNSNYVRSVA